MSMYSLDLDKEDLDIPFHQSPTIILHDAPLLMHLEEVHSSPVTEKILYERHSVIQEEDHPCSYNIEEYLMPSLLTFVGSKLVRRES